MAKAYEKKDIKAFEEAAEIFMALGRDIDMLLSTRSEFTLGKWISDAKSWAARDTEKAYYEKNARTIITIWGGNGELLDYANRQWSGLMGDYYLPRWQIFLDAILTELKGVKAVDRKALEKRWRDHEMRFVKSVTDSYAHKPDGDCYSMSLALYKKYCVR